jgi:hypothetical protein
VVAPQVETFKFLNKYLQQIVDILFMTPKYIHLQNFYSQHRAKTNTLQYIFDKLKSREYKPSTGDYH